MPVWYFFAFDARAVTEAMLQPVQHAVRSRDLAAWAKAYDLLSRTRYAPRAYRQWYSPNENSIVTDIVPDKIPSESEFGIRRTLQTFIEQASAHRIDGIFSRPSSWIMSGVSWQKILHSKAELDELELFKNEIIVRKEKLPDPFWCLESNDAVDSNYAAPEVVARMAEVEARVGLFRGLVRRTDLGDEIHALVHDMATAGLLIELAA